MTHLPLKSFLQKHKVVYLDTSIFIYFVEQYPRYYELCEAIFEEIETGRNKALTSTLTMLEILVQPYKLKRDDLVLMFYSLLTTYPNISWVDLTLDVSDLAAKIRAEHGLKTPDAIQISSAISYGAEGFICNDRSFRKVTDIDCLVIDELIR